jgi:hypothetical protein
MLILSVIPVQILMMTRHLFVKLENSDLDVVYHIQPREHVQTVHNVLLRQQSLNTLPPPVLGTLTLFARLAWIHQHVQVHTSEKIVVWKSIIHGVWGFVHPVVQYYVAEVLSTLHISAPNW